ncbi:hypothetical protein [Sphaerotilus sp.]|uniref:hypothetical protein n=1 Tax=Sphaerotilus sp. TaxID=2093942 RepID=UPI0034E2C4C3
MSPDRPTALHSAAPIRRRRVHYFSGFDPRGASHYHRLFREQGARPQPSGALVNTGTRQRSDTDPHTHHWPVQWQATAASEDPAAPSVHTEQVFMGWDDIIRAHWSRHPLALLREMLAVYAAMLFEMGLGRLRRAHPTSLLTCLLPLAGVLGALLAGAGVAWAAMAVDAVPASLRAALAAGLGLLTARFVLGQADQLGLFWLTRIHGFVRHMGRGSATGLETRTQTWIEQVIAQQQADPVDEVVLAGHSVGTLLTVGVVDGLLQDPRWQALQTGRRTAVLTMGQCYPALALLPRATAFRAALARLVAHPQLAWLDVTALIDPLCFYRTHPLASTGAAAAAPSAMPVQLAARFFQMYEPRRWAVIRRDKVQVHFLYLMTPDRAGNFDLYTLLYGPQPFESHLAQARRTAR